MALGHDTQRITHPGSGFLLSRRVSARMSRTCPAPEPKTPTDPSSPAPAAADNSQMSGLPFEGYPSRDRTDAVVSIGVEGLNSTGSGLPRTKTTATLS